jgi:hypothetical protein
VEAVFSVFTNLHTAMITTIALTIALSGQPIAGKYEIAPPPRDPSRMEAYEIYLKEIKQYPGRERWSKQEWDQLKERSSKLPLVPLAKKFGIQNDGVQST